MHSYTAIHPLLLDSTQTFLVSAQNFKHFEHQPAVKNNCLTQAKSWQMSKFLACVLRVYWEMHWQVFNPISRPRHEAEKESIAATSFWWSISFNTRCKLCELGHSGTEIQSCCILDRGQMMSSTQYIKDAHQNEHATVTALAWMQVIMCWY